MKAPDDVAAMLRLKSLGWGARRIAAELGCSRTTVRRWLRAGGWRRPPPPVRTKGLDGLEAWVEERFRRHAGNADVVRQELAAERGVAVSLRTVERAVAPLRQELRAEARATVRFETRPGQQLQIDFGQRRVEIGGAPRLVSVFVATLGWSRRLHVRAFLGERQEHWFEGMESAFRAFGGVPAEVLLDNARALILAHDVATREVTLNPRLHAFARHWGEPHRLSRSPNFWKDGVHGNREDENAVPGRAARAGGSDGAGTRGRARVAVRGGPRRCARWRARWAATARRCGCGCARPSGTRAPGPGRRARSASASAPSSVRTVSCGRPTRS
jgi:transposase